MNKLTGKSDDRRMISESESALDQLIREGARKFLQSALDNEVAEFIERMKSWRTERAASSIGNQAERLCDQAGVHFGFGQLSYRTYGVRLK